MVENGNCLTDCTVVVTFEEAWHVAVGSFQLGQPVLLLVTAEGSAVSEVAVAAAVAWVY